MPTALAQFSWLKGLSVLIPSTWVFAILPAVLVQAHLLEPDRLQREVGGRSRPGRVVPGHRRRGPESLGDLQNLQPLVGIALAGAFLREATGLWQILGVACVLRGVTLTARALASHETA